MTALPFTAFVTNPTMEPVLVPAPSDRAWMDATGNRFAYRCLPLVIANQAGWFVLNRHPVRATWTGGKEADAVRLESVRGASPPVSSHFGSGIVTWSIPVLFRTPPGWNLRARGPANMPKDGACALEGIIETDWSVATFTMNWQLTRPGLPVVFRADEPICMVVPERRGDLEAFEPAIRPIGSDPELGARHAEWARGRAEFLKGIQVPGSEASRRGWERDYMVGRMPDGSRPGQHQTKLRLRPFVRMER
jgi:hypothetical protein